MKHNTGNWDRILRAVAGVAMIICGILAPLPFVVRVLALGAGGAYMIGSALVGSCLGYKMMGISTCPIDAKGKLP